MSIIATLISKEPSIKKISATSRFNPLSEVISIIEEIGLNGEQSTLSRRLVNGRNVHFVHIVSENGDAELLISKTTAEQLVEAGYFDKINE
jgi:negative regulator of genetic competence, sporulation and motility